MKVTINKVHTEWFDVYRSALKTRNLKPIPDKVVSSEWKNKIILAEHSPIRKFFFSIDIDLTPSFVQTHLVRHKHGIEHFVSSMRNDLTGIEGAKITRETLNSMEIFVNIQGLINISRKRLCNNSHKETINVWSNVIYTIAAIEQEIAAKCVPECIYRGFCPEIKKCGFSKSENYLTQLKEYRN